MGKKKPAAEPPNQMKFSTAPVKTQEGGGGWMREDWKAVRLEEVVVVVRWTPQNTSRMVKVILSVS